MSQPPFHAIWEPASGLDRVQVTGNIAVGQTTFTAPATYKVGDFVIIADWRHCVNEWNTKDYGNCEIVKIIGIYARGKYKIEGAFARSFENAFAVRAPFVIANLASNDRRTMYGTPTKDGIIDYSWIYSLQISNKTIETYGSYAMRITGAKHLTIEDNYIYGGDRTPIGGRGVAIWLLGVTCGTIAYNKGYGGRHFIQTQFCEDLTVSRCVSTGFVDHDLDDHFGSSNIVASFCNFGHSIQLGNPSYPNLGGHGWEFYGVSCPVFYFYGPYQADMQDCHATELALLQTRQGHKADAVISWDGGSIDMGKHPNINLAGDPVGVNCKGELSVSNTSFVQRNDYPGRVCVSLNDPAGKIIRGENVKLYTASPTDPWRVPAVVTP